MNTTAHAHDTAAPAAQQATVHAEITENTLKALPAILNPAQDGYDDTSEQVSCDPAAMEDLFEAPTMHLIHPQARIHHENATVIVLVSE